ncbi:MAG: hypothetical protein QOK42_2342, partial [Frankiaceae bacterium]|nr:hypothetical protein [Frankiaceae bacterium]
MSDEPPWVPPPMTPFSARSERRALYRALLRTAVLAAVLLFAGGLVFNLVGALAGRARLGGDALDRFEQALVVAHPDLVLNGSGRGTESYRWRLTSTNTFQYLEAGQTKEADVRLTRSFGGGADASYPETALTRASHRGR